MSASDLYPVVVDLTEAEYGCCCYSEGLGSFSLEDLIVPSLLPLSFTTTNSIGANDIRDDCINEEEGGERTPPRRKRQTLQSRGKSANDSGNATQQHASVTPASRPSSPTSPCSLSSASTSDSKRILRPWSLLSRGSSSIIDSPELRQMMSERSFMQTSDGCGIESSITKDNSVSLSMESTDSAIISCTSFVETGGESGNDDRLVRFDQTYVLIREIIRCSVSTLWECVHRETGERHCAKIIDRRRFSGAADEESTVREVAMLQSIAEYKSPYMTSVVQIFEDQYQVYIVMEYIDGISLLSRLCNRDLPPLSEIGIKRIARSLIEGVQQLHALNICHHFLTEDNLIIVEKQGFIDIKICDFGQAVYADSELRCCEGRFGDLAHAAPEILRRRNHTTMSDMWSVGVILYRCFSGQLPFTDSSKRRLVEKIIRGDYNFEHPLWRGVSRHAKQFISNLLQVDPAVRCTSRDALDHVWLAPPTMATTELLQLPPPLPRSPPTKKSRRKKVLKKLGSWLSSHSGSDSGGGLNSPRQSNYDRSMTHEMSSISTFSSKASNDRSPTLWRRNRPTKLP